MGGMKSYHSCDSMLRVWCRDDLSILHEGCAPGILRYAFSDAMQGLMALKPKDLL